jgi:hypothetical protein
VFNVELRTKKLEQLTTTPPSRESATLRRDVLSSNEEKYRLVDSESQLKWEIKYLKQELKSSEEDKGLE